MPGWSDMIVNIAEDLAHKAKLLPKFHAELLTIAHTLRHEPPATFLSGIAQAINALSQSALQHAESPPPNHDAEEPADEQEHPPLPNPGANVDVATRVVSTGSHQSARTTNAERAAQQQQARRSHSVVSEHWVEQNVLPAEEVDAIRNI